MRGGGTLVYLKSVARTSIFEYDEVAFLPYYSVGMDRKQNRERYLGKQRNNNDFKNYFMASNFVISELLDIKKNKKFDKSQLIELSKIMTSMKNTFEKYGKFPRESYKTVGKLFPEGWVSSMDAPRIMVASRMLYELTKDEQWNDFVKKLSVYVVKDISEGGFSLKVAEGVWPLEYAKNNITYDESLFVLNGSLTGYLALYMMSEVDKDLGLDVYLRSVEQVYEKMFSKFYYENENFLWAKYMLHPPTVIPPHYMIYEKELFGALASVTGKDLFRREYKKLVHCLESVLKPQFKRVGSKVYFIIRRACPPHPYLIDCFPTRIEFYDNEGKRINQPYINGSKNMTNKDLQGFKAGEFLYGEVPENAMAYSYYRNDTGELLFKKDIVDTDFIKENDATQDLSFNLITINDAKLINDKKVLISGGLSEKTEATLICKLKNIEKLDMSCLYGIELENLSSMKLYMGLCLYDTDKKGTTRYYTPLNPGKNLVLFNIIGFPSIDKLKNFQRIDIRIYTNDSNTEGLCKMGKILRFRDMFALREYRKHSKYEISLQ